jgi:hypothetical protein
MKKTVRIRKAKKGETPGYINKTKQFLEKAQTGMSVSNNGEQQQLMQQIYTTAYNSLMNDSPADVVYYNIINDYGVDANTASMIMQYAFQQLVQEGYINPEEMQDQTGEQTAEQEQPTQQGPTEEEISEQQEQEELAMSEMDEDNSHIYNYANEDSFDEQAMQEEAFKFGGSNPPFKKYTLKIGNKSFSVPAPDFKRLKDIWVNLNDKEKLAALGAAGASAAIYNEVESRNEQKEETGLGYQNNRKVNANFGYGGFYNEGGSAQDPILDQYDRAGQMNKPNFSLDKMIQNQAGVQLFDPQGTNISNYLPNYKSVASWNNENWLAKKGGAVPELPKADMGLITKPFTGLKKGYDWYNKIPQLQNVSTLGKMAPIFTGAGYALHKTPGLNWMLGMKGGPQQDSYLSQNIIGLQNLTQGKPTGNELFSKNVANPEELNVDRLVFATEDLQNIITKGNTEGRSSFVLSDAVAGEGSIGGIYGKNTKISMGQDDVGNKFFDLSTSYKPGDATGYFTIPSDGKAVKFRNRFYYKPNEAGTFEIFDGLGEPLVAGTNNMFKVTRPLVPSLTRTLGETMFGKAGSTLGSTYPLSISTGPGIRTSSWPKSLISREEITSLPPTAWGDLGTKGQIGRGIEQLGYQYGTFPFGAISSALGYNPLRTRGKNIIDISEPTLSYGNTSKNITAPLDDVNVAEDIMNNTNYFRRKGRNAFLLGGLGTYLGYNAYDAMYGEPDAPPLGPVRSFLPRDTRTFPMTNDYQLQIPDSLEGMGDPSYFTPKGYNIYRRGNLDNLDWDTIPENQKEGGKVSKRKFTKKFLSFYEEGGENPNDPNTIGKGDRMDTGTREVGKIVPNFTANLKNDSNTAKTQEIYDLAKDNPEIMQTLMANGQLKENLADEQNQPMVEAKFGRSMGDIPSWYTGYMNNMMSPRQYKKLHRQLKRMMPRGVDISRAGYASSIGGYPGGTLNYPGYMSMFNDYALGNYGGYPGGEYPTPSSEEQANEVEVINNTNAITGALQPAGDVDVINNANNTVKDLRELFGRKFRDPIVGETWDTWWTSNGNTPGFRPDKRKWNGSEWVYDKEDLQQFQGHAREINNSDIQDYQNFFSNMKMQSGGFVNMNAENPLTRFVSGGMESESYEPYDIPKAYEGMHQNCPPGYVYNSTYGQCVPMMQYRPNYVPGRTTSGGLFRTLTPWNRVIGRGMPWTQQTSLPYFANSGDPYMGQLGPMVMRDVHKSTLFGRKPKKWTEYYDPSGKGITPEMLELMQNNQGGGKKRRRKDRDGNIIDDASDMATNLVQDVSEGIEDFNQNRRDRRYSKYLGNRFGEDYWYGDRADDDWVAGYAEKDDPYKYHADDMEDGIPGMRSQKQLDKLYAWEDKQRFKGVRKEKRQDIREQNQLDREEAKRFRSARRKLKNPKAQSALGGYLPQARFGAFDPNTGFGVGMGDKTSAYNQYSPQTEFENELFGGDTWGAQQETTPFSFITPTGTGSYAETRNTGATLDQQGQNVIPQKQDPVDPCADATQEELMDPTSECYNPGLIGVDKKSKKMREVVFEPGINVGNAGGRFLAGVLDKRRTNKPFGNYMMGKMSTEENAPTTTAQNYGNYVSTMGPTHGLLRYDQMGQDASGMAADVTQFGGPISKRGETHKMYNGLNMRNSDHKHYEKDQVTYMTQEELDNYLAAGGQVEYLY